MEDKRVRPCMSMRKLALWHTRHFQPIVNHSQLERLMDTLGFMGLPPMLPSFNGGTTWKEYVYIARGQWGKLVDGKPPPRPRLPYPRIDGLHYSTYQAFLEAVNFYLQMQDVSTLFHVRGMSLSRVDLCFKWNSMEEDEQVYVYRQGTLDQTTLNVHSTDCNANSSKGNNSHEHNSVTIHNDKEGNSQLSRVVPLEQIIVTPKEEEEGTSFQI